MFRMQMISSRIGLPPLKSPASPREPQLRMQSSMKSSAEWWNMGNSALNESRALGIKSTKPALQQRAVNLSNQSSYETPLVQLSALAHCCRFRRRDGVG